MDLEEMLCAARDQRPGAWTPLAPRLTHELRHFFGRMFDDVDAKDLAQTTIAIVAHKIPGFEPRVSLTKWVFGIARNQARMEFRARYRRAAHEAVLDGREWTPDTSPSERIDRMRLLERIKVELERLPAHYRRSVEHELDDGDAETLARSEGIAPGTARTRRHRAHELLRRAVVDE